MYFFYLLAGYCQGNYLKFFYNVNSITCFFSINKLYFEYNIVNHLYNNTINGAQNYRLHNKKILPSEIILSQPKISAVLLIITLIGLPFITLSVLTKLKIINPPPTYFSLFPGMGILFTAGSSIFMINKIPLQDSMASRKLLPLPDM